MSLTVVVKRRPREVIPSYRPNARLYGGDLTGGVAETEAVQAEDERDRIHPPENTDCRAMRISREQVLHVANLAKAGLTEQEVETDQEQLSAILEYIDTLSARDTSNAWHRVHVMGLGTVLRPGEPRPSLPREGVLANAPVAQDE